MDKIAMAQALKKLAMDYRQKAQDIKSTKHIKCAQILTAAKGLGQFKKILTGEI